MDKSELLKGLKKVDMNLIKQSDIKMFKAEKMAVEYYNDAVDNIVEGNTDIAIIKLKKVISFSPDFSEASQLLEKISDYENSHSIGDKVYESMHGRDVNAKLPVSYRRTLPQMLNINPRILIKIILVLVVIAITAGGVLLVIRMLDSKSEDPENVSTEITYSQDEVNALNTRIDELETLLAKSEVETQEALSSSTGSDETIQQLEETNYDLNAQLNLYKAEVLFQQEEYELSADMAKSLSADDYKGEDKELYNKVYNQAIFQAANYHYKTGLSLHSQKDYEGAVLHLEKVDDYSPEFAELGNCYFRLALAYYELGEYNKALELYENIAKNKNELNFENETGLIYYTAKTYQKLENYTKAKELYNHLIATYPTSSLVGHSKDRLREMPAD